ncbi:MAG: hypothetical protein MPN21_18105 [Thermoanaerobaculia bacterium]|nr:hypothetical protein [Thermoanaerobaculia bacterium]
MSRSRRSAVIAAVVAMAVLIVWIARDGRPPDVDPGKEESARQLLTDARQAMGRGDHDLARRHLDQALKGLPEGDLRQEIETVRELQLQQVKAKRHAEKGEIEALRGAMSELDEFVRQHPDDLLVAREVDELHLATDHVVDVIGQAQLLRLRQLVLYAQDVAIYHVENTLERPGSVEDLRQILGQWGDQDPTLVTILREFDVEGVEDLGGYDWSATLRHKESGRTFPIGLPQKKP